MHVYISRYTVRILPICTHTHSLCLSLCVSLSLSLSRVAPPQQEILKVIKRFKNKTSWLIYPAL